MKKQINPTVKAHLLRGAFYLLLLSAGILLALFRPEAPANVSHRTLTFAERVAYQRAIEEVYWRHRIWPEENAKPKPSFDEVMSAEQIEKKVADYLRDSRALEAYWQKPIAPDQLQAEMERMARNTKQPEVLRELFEALGNDPSVIAEGLARPVLAERLAAGLSGHEKGQRFALLRTQVSGSKFSITTSGKATYTLPEIDPCTDDTWTSTSTTSAPEARYDHTAVWTGSEMIVWGGSNDFIDFHTGGRYNPSTDTWTATSTTNAPGGRIYHTAVWTGSEMIVWGGDAGGVLNTGGRYNPSTDSWTATSTTSAPVGRLDHTAVWSGSEMIVWGGAECLFPNCGVFNSGGRYNPITDTWTPTTTTNAPAARFLHTAVWTGSEMIVWGASGVTGGRYNPGTDSWTATSTTNAPSARYWHTAVWTGSEMIVWGGNDGLNTGGRYNPSTDSWTATSTTFAPVGRYDHTAVWTDSEMIVWGGRIPNAYLNDGGRYNPSADTWTAASTTNAPEPREAHKAVWTGSEMIVWGGYGFSGNLNTGGRYCAQSGPTPTPTPTPMGCSVTSSQPPCGSIVVSTAPTDFTVNLSDPADPATVQGSDFTVNGTPANTATLLNGNTTITFHFNTSPAVQGQNTMHIPAGAFNCGNGPVQEFTCTFSYEVSTPTPTPTASSTPTATPTPTPTSTPRPTPTPRSQPSVRPRPTPPPRP